MLKIYDTSIDMSKDPEDQLYVTLSHDCSVKECNEIHRDIMLRVIDKKGNKIDHGTILDIDIHLEVIVRYWDVNKIIPLKKDINNHILAYTMEEYLLYKHRKAHEFFVNNMTVSANDSIDINTTSAKSTH